ncbi:MAG: zinc ribbon domain-containing protein [Thermoanaerobaculales bacterium]|jgi:general secretion pathway protein G|nr:zinc ribbon domain-containing protein [Thermoanaerobaculales bacterium]
MSHSLGCPHCGQVMTIPDHRAGTRLFCTACNQPFDAPDLAPGGAVAICPSCGAEVAADARFCAGCGAFTGAGLSPGELVRRPALVTLLAVLDAIGGAFALLAGIAVLLLGLSSGDTMSAALALIYLVLGGVSLACAIGLWRLRPWGRTLAIGLAIVGLLGIPVGTIISILILVYLFRPEVKLLFSGRSPEELAPHELALLARASGSGPSIVAIIVGLLVALFLCGIVSAIAIPNLVNAINRGRQKRTLADIRTIALATEAYAVDHRHYPVAATSLAELEAVLTPTYAAALPAADGWRVPFEVRTGDDGSWYEIASLGRDGLPGDRSGGLTTDFDCDVVWRNGVFVQWPEGLQVD